jgi:hypothetical protein
MYNEFIEFIQELADNHPNTGLKEEIEFALQSIKEDEEGYDEEPEIQLI